MPETRYLIFTDMDGSLLDHDTYSHAAADQTLARLKQLNIPVIPNTSKTFAELQVINRELDSNAPFMVENGAAVFIPHNFFAQQPPKTDDFEGYWVREFTSLRTHWQALLEQVEPQFTGLFEHFATMSIERLCQTTGLSKSQAEKASDRHFSEPVLWHGDNTQRQNFIQALIKLGASPLQGGRFIHVSGECNKGRAMQWLMSEFVRQQTGDETFKSIAVGDSQNDIAMLEAADIAVRIKSPAQPLPELTRKQQVYSSTLTGPEGWRECIETILAQYF